MSVPSQEGLFSLCTVPGYTPLAAPPATLPHAAVRPAAKPSPRTPGRAAGKAGKDTAEDVSWIRTAEDVMAYFERWGESAPTQFFYCLRSEGGAEGGAAPERSAAEFFLKVVPPGRTTHLPSYYIMSKRQLVKVDRCTGEHTDSVPLAEWAAHKRAYLHLRGLTFFGSFSLAKCFQRWRGNYRTRLLRRRRRQLQAALFPARPAFQAALLEAAVLLEGLRAVRAACVQPRRLYSAADWAEQQVNWRSRKAQPEVEAAVAGLARAAEGVCARVEAEAERMLAGVKAQELGDRIGVDLYAATSAAKARSMQQIRGEKQARAEAYHNALAHRAQLPRFLRMLDLRLAGALAGMAAGSVADAAAALHAAAPGLLPGAAAGVGQGCGQDTSADGELADSPVPAEAAAGSGEGPATPAFLCSLVVEAGGGIGFSPSQAEWAAALEGEVLASSLRLAGGVLPLLRLPAFERYQVQQAAEGAAAGEPEQAEQQPAGAAELAERDGEFVGAAADLAAMVQHSFARAGQLARQYQQYLAIHQFGCNWDYEAWATQQRAGMDLAGAEATLRQLQAWRQQLEVMPLSQAAGLVRLDATHLQASLQPAVREAQEGITALLLQLAGEQCRQLLTELGRWGEVAAARPPDLDAGFLPWAAELALMQQEAAGQVAAAAAIDAALELVAAFAGRLPTADAVKRDDLREAAAGLPAALQAAAAWQVEQREVHAAAVADQAGVLAEEAIQLEAELKAGGYADAGAAVGEVLADLELQQARLGSAAAQAEALAQLQQEMGVETRSQEEIRDAAAALQRCTGVWSLVAEAEALQASLAGDADGLPIEGSEGGGAGPPSPEQASRQLAGMQERLLALRGAAAAPDPVWLRASNAVLACRGLLAG